MCNVNPFPLKPTCAHRHDELDRDIMRFLVDDRDSFHWAITPASLRNALTGKHTKYASWHQSHLRKVISNRLQRLFHFGWVDRRYEATFQAKESYQLWLWSGIVDLSN